MVVSSAQVNWHSLLEWVAFCMAEENYEVLACASMDMSDDRITEGLLSCTIVRSC